MSEAKYTIDQHGDKIEDFLDTILDHAGLELDFTIGPPTHFDPDFEHPDLTVEFEGEDSDILLANKAELLLALEMLTLELLRVPGDEHARISFDCNDYRKLRMQELRMTADAAADRVVSTGSPFTFNPMNSRERRMIHLSLRNREDVRSESASSIHGRYVVIYPAAMATPAEPPQPPGPFFPKGSRPEGGPPSRGRDDERRGDRGDRGGDRRGDRGRRDGGRGGDRSRGRGPRRND